MTAGRTRVVGPSTRGGLSHKVPGTAGMPGMSGGIAARGGAREATGRNPRRDRRRSRATSNALQNAALVAANLVGLGAFFWPFALPAAVGGERAHALDAPVILVMLLGCLGAVLFLQLGQGGMGPKAVALIGVLGAAMVALRLPGFIAGFSAMFIVVLVAGNAFGARFGFVLGAIGTFASGLFVGGLGPWLPFQMVAVGWVGMGAGLLPRGGLGRTARAAGGGSWRGRLAWLAAYGVVSGFAFGAIINLWFWPYAAGSSTIGWAPELGGAANLGRYLRFYAVTSLGWDAFRAVGNAALVILLGRPLLGALDRAARRMNLVVRAVDNG
jgi:energy-coupling factor transport system substrate-specific component